MIGCSMEGERVLRTNEPVISLHEFCSISKEYDKLITLDSCFFLGPIELYPIIDSATITFDRNDDTIDVRGYYTDGSLFFEASLISKSCMKGGLNYYVAYDNENLKIAEYSYLDGDLGFKGNFRAAIGYSLYQSGQVKEKIDYSQSGIQRIRYFENGTIESHCKFDSLMNSRGIQRFWHSNGELLREYNVGLGLQPYHIRSINGDTMMSTRIIDTPSMIFGNCTLFSKSREIIEIQKYDLDTIWHDDGTHDIEGKLFFEN